MKGLVKYDLMQLAGTSKKSFYLLLKRLKQSIKIIKAIYIIKDKKL